MFGINFEFERNSTELEVLKGLFTFLREFIKFYFKLCTYLYQKFLY